MRPPVKGGLFVVAGPNVPIRASPPYHNT
jgi:hypothetical protein